MAAMHEKAICSEETSALTRSEVVRFGSTVVYQELPAGTSRRVTLVGPLESDASAGRISVLSPIGRALLGCRKGQVVDVELPMGRTLAVRVKDVVAASALELDEPSYA